MACTVAAPSDSRASRSSDMAEQASGGTATARKKRRNPLDLIEVVGNKLPDPSVLFVIGTLIVMGVSALGASMGWEVPEVRPVVGTDEAGKPTLVLENTGEDIRPVSLLSSSGLYWCISTMVSNFINFPPLGIVLVGMLGIGVAERTGLIAAALKSLMLVTPRKALTPMMVFLGVMSSVGSDAGYIILPPLAAALYKSVGRAPLVGIAAVFAGVSGGFSANLFISGGDPVIAGLSTSAARLLDPGYEVLPTCNWYFMIVSTFLLTFVGWFVTARIVEPRLSGKGEEEGGPSRGAVSEMRERPSREEKRGLLVAGIALVVVAVIGALCVAMPGWPLFGKAPSSASPRWAASIIPMIFFGFLAPAVAYGVVAGSVKRVSDVIPLMNDSMKAMAPVVVLAFFAAQFIAYFNYSNLGRMLAMAGGEALASADMPRGVLILLFIALSAFFNLFIGSMSAKYAILAPIFIPMLMLVGISPELAQMSYRIGDSITNVITPLNSYMVIIIVVMQRFAPKAGIGTMVAMMLPYTVCFGIAWAVMMLVWLQTGAPLGLGGPLEYLPSGQ